MALRHLVLGILVLPPAAAGASEPPKLSHNPFSRPPSQTTISDDARVPNPDGTTPAIELQATMVAANDRLANVAGRILRPGDEVQGFTLVRVYEDRAVFSRQGHRQTIFVKPHLVEKSVDNDE